jgi:hypothetical protein
MTAVVAACALNVQAQQLRIATICAGASTLDNGSIITIGQPLVGALSAGPGGVTLTAGIIPTLPLTLNTSPTPPAISALTLLPGRVFRFSFPVQPGHNYVVEASTNLTTWSPVWTNPATAPGLFQDPDAPQYPRRFYRVLTW